MAMRFDLRELEPGDEAALRAAVASFADSDPGWDFAFHFDDVTDFAAYVEDLKRQRDGIDLPDGWVPHSYWVAVDEGGAIIGRVSLRHQLTPYLRDVGGHIGFGVVASHRGRGVATELLQRSIPRARAVGIDRMLVTCDETNTGSRRVIERCGAVFEDSREREGGGLTRRYWIDL